MALIYLDKAELIRQRLTVAHDPKIARIRGAFFEEEFSFFRSRILDQRVLVAGSGLGHDSFALAPTNKYVLGIELLPPFTTYANREAKRQGLENVYFVNGDFLSLPLAEAEFDAAILNMGTIGNFEEKASLVGELLHAADRLFIDFYTAAPRALERRRRMYEEERWRNVRVRGARVVSDDGLDSASVSPAEISAAVEQAGGRVAYHTLCDFAVMAEITK